MVGSENCCAMSCEKTCDARSHVEDTVMKGFAALSLSIGYELGLFNHLSPSPKTSVEIADQSGYKERYVREWLNAMTVAKLIESSDDGKTFWMPASSKHLFADGSPLMLYATALPMFATVYDKIFECFKKNGPLGTDYSNYEKFFTFMTNVSDKSQYESLISEFIPTVPGMIEKLRNGGSHMDIGCGRGTASYIIGKSFPKCESYGADIVKSAIDFANDRVKKENVPNVHYVAADASKLPQDWTGKFDYVTAFDAIHDQSFPHIVLKEIFRVLKPGGIFSMADIDAHTNVHQNKCMKAAPFLYTCSLFHCMPVSLQSSGGLGLGTMWGKEKAGELLKEAGFSNIIFHPIPNSSFFNYHCIGQKPS